MTDRPARPPQWTALDAEVETQAERVRNLFCRHREASAAARAGSERVAEVEREDRAARASAVAQGGDDPGADRSKLNRAEKAAADAGERAGILADALSEAAGQLEAVCVERAPQWQQQAREALDSAAVEMRESVAAVEASYERWRRARQQLELAGSEVARRKSAALREVEAPGVGILPSALLAALSHVPDSVEPEPVETAAFVASE